MLPGVRPSMRFASMPTASTRFVSFSTATTDGSMSTMPRPRTETSVLAVPRSTAMSPPQELKNISMSDKALLLPCGHARGRVYLQVMRPSPRGCADAKRPAQV